MGIASEIRRKREVVDLLYGNIYIGLAMTVICFSALVFGFAHTRGDTLKIVLWVVMMIVMLFRLFDTLYWQSRLQGTAFDPDPPAMRFISATIATALVWVTYILLMYDHMSNIEQASTLTVLGALTVGASSSLAPNKHLALLYTGLLILPISLMSAMGQSSAFMAVGYIGLAYWLVVSIMVRRSHDIHMRFFSLKETRRELDESHSADVERISTLETQLHAKEVELTNAKTHLESEVVKRTNDIHRLSNRDPLTGLFNRGGFVQNLATKIGSTKSVSRFAILFVDLDGFKRVNDTLGHQVGDKVLVEVAKRLSRYCETDHLARWGGDEFVFALPYASHETAMAVATACRSGITVPIDMHDKQISLDATIGIALCPDHGDNAQSLVEQADLAMYEQKRIQRGGVGVFSETIQRRVKQEQTLMEGLHKAISRSELSVVYQPIVNASDKKLLSIEALLRWQFDGQTIPPDVFIPLAEKSGLIHEIGIWVLHRACIDAAQWQHDDELQVSVNVSVIQLMDEGFLRSIDTVLMSSGLNPQRLHLEITESVFADNKAKVIHQVNAIKARKVHISIDDFGTGFSSLSQLNSLSFDTIKIDRSFVQQLEQGSDTIVRATLFIAQEFGCRTIAEGIETKEHCDRLIAMGVDAFQGYYFAKPLALPALNDWYLNRDDKKSVIA